jgi:SAM-dependent methyltransferase
MGILMDKSVGTDWYATAFNALYPVIYAHRTVEAAAPEADFAAGQMDLRHADRVLDLCCGNGRHMARLSRYTDELTGLDYSGDLLQIARKQLGPSSRLLRGDMRTLPFDVHFDVVMNFFTSFGYFTDPDENMAVAEGIYRVLKPDGRFFMDYLNPAHVKKTLVPHSERTQDGYRIIEDRWIDEATQRVNKTMVVDHEGETVLRSGESVRMYDRKELASLLGAAGLAIDRVFGDYSGATFDEDQPRMIIVGHKSK